MKPSLLFGLAALAGTAMLTPLHAGAQQQTQPSVGAQQSSPSGGSMSGTMDSGRMRADLSSQQIKQAQSALKEQNLYSGEIDGIVGRRTRMAVLDYQAQENLPRSGRLDRQTIDSLMGMSSSGTMNSKDSGATGMGRRSNQ